MSFPILLWLFCNPSFIVSISQTFSYKGIKDYPQNLSCPLKYMFVPPPLIIPLLVFILPLVFHLFPFFVCESSDFFPWPSNIFPSGDFWASYLNVSNGIEHHSTERKRDLGEKVRYIERKKAHIHFIPLQWKEKKVQIFFPRNSIFNWIS